MFGIVSKFTLSTTLVKCGWTDVSSVHETLSQNVWCSSLYLMAKFHPGLSIGVLHSFFCDINRLIHLLIRQQNWLRSIQKDFICQFQKHTIKLIGRSFIMQQDKDPRTHWQDNKGVHQELKVVSSKLAMSVSKLQFTCWREDWQLEEVASQAWKSTTKEENKSLVMSVGHRFDASIACKGI